MTTTAKATKAETPASKANWGRKRLRRAGKKALAKKLVADKEFAKTYFDARSKRSVDKKQAFRKKKSRKK